MAKKDEFFMRRCLELALEAKANGRTAVGAVLVKNDEIIAEGAEGSSDLPAPLAHAEIVAIIKAMDKVGSKDLGGCILYTTVEPCLMCSYLIRETVISKVVYGAKAGDIGGIQGKYPVVTSESISKWPQSVAIKDGLMEDECLKLLQRK